MIPHLISLTHRSGHHSQYSGSTPITQFLPGKVISPNLRSFFPYRLRKFLAQRRSSPYSSTSVAKESQLIYQMIRHRNGIAFFLHAEHDFYYSGFVSRVLGWRTLGWFHYPPKQLEKLFPNPLFLKRLDRCLCVGSNQVSYLKQVLGHERVNFLPLGVDTEFFAYKYSIDPHPQCLFVGQHLRDFGLLGDVLRALKSVFPQLESTAVLRADYQSLLPDFSWLNRRSGISDEELREMYQMASCLLLPLIDSTACDAILEAIACGLPVVTTDVGGVRDYLNDDCAILCPPGDVQSMVQAAYRLLTDPETNGRMRRAAREQALKFSWKAVADQFTGILERDYSFEMRVK